MSDNEDDLDNGAKASQPVIIDYAAREKEDDERFPNRPQNHSDTLPFRTLFQDLFDPLLANKKPIGPAVARRKVGPRAVASQAPHEIRRGIIERYISRWRKEVGDDFYPAMRLILPDKDRDRAMYGLKEKVLAKYIIKILKIDKNSEDGYNLLNWKQPGQGMSAKRAGDFPGRVHEVLSKRPFRVEPGNMTIEEVNDLLNKLSSAAKEEQQLPIVENFYRCMNPDELRWLICIILRTMHVGATEKTFLDLWHPDAETLFNISSSLKKVCWELWNTSIRLRTDGDRGIELFECFQPQLAQFQPKKMNSIVAKMQTENDPEFWIEEKLDGERMQMHMATIRKDKKGDSCTPYKEFKFFSRKAKDYTYLYGDRIDEKKSALTQHLHDAFDDGVESIILDGEMITWDTETDKMVPFGTLKTAALEHQSNPFSTDPRPLYRVFDILHLNGADLTRYTLIDRRNALERTVRPVHRRLEILEYTKGRTWDDVETALRQVVAEASEGLVVKNPRSRYRLNDRNDDWIKVKPEYMEEFGESLDCIVVGGYYGSGKRGGGLSSFLCALRVDDPDGDGPPQKFLSFFKVGGGLTANDYSNIRHQTEGKWIKWDRDNPPTEVIELGGGEQYQRERPDVWIKPEDSVVIQAKAASVGTSDEFAAGLTLRFPRFQKLRSDKDWKTALSRQEFLDLRETAQTRNQENKQQAKMQAETRKRHQRVDIRKKPLQVVGYTRRSINEAESQKDDTSTTNIFRGLIMYVMTGTNEPAKKTRIEIEELIKVHGGHIIQTAYAKPQVNGQPVDEIVCIASKREVKVVSLTKKGDRPILKPLWLYDCIEQARRDMVLGMTAIPLRPEKGRHIFYSPNEREDMYNMEVDRYGDSFARNTTMEELRKTMSEMQDVKGGGEIDERLFELVGESPGWLFRNTVMLFVDDNADGEGRDIEFEQDTDGVQEAKNLARFGSAKVVTNLDDSQITHVVVSKSVNGKAIRRIRSKIAQKKRLPRMVTVQWIKDSWAEKTRLDEERYTPM